MDLLFLSIYKTFQEKTNLFEQAGIEPIKHIDMYRGQPLNPEQFEYYDIPALFIDWRINWTKDKNYYDGLLNLDFHLITDATWDTSNISTNNKEGLSKVLYHGLVRVILDTLKSDNIKRMKRIDETPVDTGVINYHILRYQCEYIDPMLNESEYIDAMIEQLKLNGGLAKKL